MESKRSREIKHEMALLESQSAFLNSCISLLMADANLIDQEIEGYVRRAQDVQSQLRDLSAELKDTI